MFDKENFDFSVIQPILIIIMAICKAPNYCQSQEENTFLFGCLLFQWLQKKPPGISILLHSLLVSIQNIKKSAKTKEVEIKNLIRASANGNNKLSVKKNSNLEIIYRKITLFNYFHTDIHIHVPVLQMTCCDKLSRELHVWVH